MSRRVVVTGLGAVTPIGNSVDDFWASVKAGTVRKYITFIPKE